MEKLGDYKNMDAETLSNAAALLDLCLVRINNNCGIVLYDKDTNDLIIIADSFIELLHAIQYMQEGIKHVGIKVINGDSLEVGLTDGEVIEPARKILKVV